MSSKAQREIADATHEHIARAREGSTLRSKNDKYAKDYSQWLLHYQTVDLEIEKAQKFKKLGLQAEPQKK